MISPSILQPGDKVYLCAPGRKLDEDKINHAVAIIQSWGLQVITGKNLLSSKHSYLAGSDTERLKDLQYALDNPSIKAIFCVRGGYGTTRILDSIDFTTFLKNPKWICGFSDITALHLKLQKIRVQSIHGTMPVMFSKNDSASSAESLKSILFGNREPIVVSHHSSDKEGNGRGELIGGNLSLIVDSLGTSSEIQTEGKILILEEVDEPLYKIDRMLVQLKRAGKLKNLAGLIIGHMTDIKDTELPFGETIEQIILNNTKDFNYPVAFSFPTGHEDPNLSWISGATAKLTVTSESTTLHFR
jgi:muramoyltetrapeptide carboxypeptidase